MLRRAADRIPAFARLRTERNRLSAEVVDLRDQLARTEADGQAALLDVRDRAERAEAEAAALRQEVAQRPAESGISAVSGGHSTRRSQTFRTCASEPTSSSTGL